MVSRPDVSGLEMRTRDDCGGCQGLLYLINDLPVTQQKIVRALQQRLAKILPVNWPKPSIRVAIDRSLCLQKRFDELLWRVHGANTRRERRGPAADDARLVSDLNGWSPSAPRSGWAVDDCVGQNHSALGAPGPRECSKAVRPS